MRKDGSLKEFLATPEPPELGPGPRAGVKTLERLNSELDASLGSSGLTQERQQLIRALVLLWHDHLDAAHRLAQDIDNPDGAFVHGIMHRREPDASNAAYWFRRVGSHAAFLQLAKRAGSALSPADGTLLNRLVQSGEWDPFAFIEACGRSDLEPGKVAKLRQVQQLETEALLEILSSQ